MDEITLNQCVGFDWDKGNQSKNEDKHLVTRFECEQVFFNEPLLLYEDIAHSQNENRHYALGKTDSGRALFIAFTIRKKLIRIISSRDMSKKERRIYHES
jgi:uncharacterized DUF497 family protein